jgi:hypothetical protein
VALSARNSMASVPPSALITVPVTVPPASGRSSDMSVATATPWLQSGETPPLEMSLTVVAMAVRPGICRVAWTLPASNRSKRRR